MSYVERVFRGIYWMWIVIGLIALVNWFAPFGKDDTDPPSGRSGLRLYTDNRTGCQYLQGGLFGGMSPRFDASGKQICAAIRN